MIFAGPNLQPLPLQESNGHAQLPDSVCEWEHAWCHAGPIRAAGHSCCGPVSGAGWVVGGARVSVSEGIRTAHDLFVCFFVCLRKAVQDYKKKSKQPLEKISQEVETPPELVCDICKELMKDAVIIPCCGESYCYGCIQEYLCENEFTCPACKKDNVSPENLAPNKALRAVSNDYVMIHYFLWSCQHDGSHRDYSSFNVYQG